MKWFRVQEQTPDSEWLRTRGFVSDHILTWTSWGPKSIMVSCWTNGDPTHWAPIVCPQDIAESEEMPKHLAEWVNGRIEDYEKQLDILLEKIGNVKGGLRTAWDEQKRANR